MQALAGLLSLQVIPVAVLALCAGDASYRRHSRFGLRFAATVVVIMLPEVMFLGPRLGEQGATVLGGTADAAGQFEPALVLDGQPSMRVAQTDLFAPVLTVLDAEGFDGVVAAQETCPLALTASIFGDEGEARGLAKRLKVGHVTINDLIVATADPRVPFTGRKQSGFGPTRGAEGLLEMTVPRVLAVQRGSGARRYERTGAAHVGLFAGMAALLYGAGAIQRIAAAKRVVNAARAVAKASSTTRLGDV